MDSSKMHSLIVIGVIFVFLMNWIVCSPIYQQTTEVLKTYESICNNDDEYRCVYTTLNQRTYNGLNTKIQGPTECKALVKEKCGKIKNLFDKTYFWADQNDPNCSQIVALIY